MVLSLLDLSNGARACAAAGQSASLAAHMSEIESRLRLPLHRLENELHGRKAVDACLNLALAGAGEQQAWMFDVLFAQADREVKRWGRRRSCTSMTLVQLAERAAAAGCCAPLGLYSTLGEILMERGEAMYEGTARALAADSFSLATSEQAARWVYRASSRMGKEVSESADGLGSNDWDGGASDLATLFMDSTRPLTVDLGCGFGCGPLVYAQSSAWEGDNVLGCDLSAAGVGYARGVASRWQLKERCRFVRADARRMLRAASECYPGGLHRVILSCPTPYASMHLDTTDDAPDDTASGNRQLRAATAEDPCFLGHSSVFESIQQHLAPGGTLYLASNVEDVALTLLRTAQLHTDLTPLSTPQSQAAVSAATTAAMEQHTVPRRQQRWRAAGGERADAPCWRAGRPMPWASETERNHRLEGRPVHRVVLRKPSR